MAESVDALVSNTSGVTSIPVRPRVWVPQEAKQLRNQCLAFFYFIETFPSFSPQVQKYGSKSLFSLATQYKYTTFEKINPIK